MWNKEFLYVTEDNVRDVTALDIMNSPIIGVDIEASSLDPRNGTLLSVQIATPDNTYVYDARRVELQPLMDKLKDYEGTVVVQNGSFDLKYLYSNYGFWWTKPKFYDTFHAQRLKNVGRAATYKEKFMGLDKLVKGYLDYEVNKEIRESFTFVGDDALTEQQLEYAAEDAAILLPLYNAMEPKVRQKQSEFIIDLEMALLPVTASMEYWGIRVDQDYWRSIAVEKEIVREEGRVEFVEKMKDYGWENINPNSWQQLKKAFIEDIGIKIPDTTMDTFKDNRHRAPDIIDPLLQFKGFRQACTTFGQMWLRHVHEDGNVYASFNQLGADTGRYSCDSPNLQNIPVRDDPRYREAFIARDDYVIITADLSQIEYRIAGELSGEEIIINEYMKAEPDFHQLTADQAGAFLGFIIERFTGKTMNFALIYQAGPSRLIRLLGCDMRTAKRLHAGYWGGYPNLKKFMVRTGTEARIKGYSKTKLGRYRYFVTPVNAPVYKINAIEREGGNMPIQGAAADILKIATLDMFSKLERIQARIIHQVHDEVVVEAPEDTNIVEEAISIIDNSMKFAGGHVLERVPVVTDFSVSRKWSK